MIPDPDIRNRAPVTPRPADIPTSAPAPVPLAVGVDIGPARWRELRAVARLQRRAFRPALAYGLTTLVVLRALPSVRFLVARSADEVLGCAIGDPHEGQARVINLAVDPEVRRRGVGTALLRALEAALPQGDIILMVEADNDGAQALYRREGYLQVGAAADYYGRGRPGIWMQKQRPTAEGRPAATKLRV